MTAAAEQAGPEQAGRERVGPGRIGPEQAEAERAEPERAEPRQVEAERTEQSPRAWLRARRASLSRRHIMIAAFVLVVFLAISALLARFLSTENVERDDVLAVLEAQAAGDAHGMLGRLHDCGRQSRCAATVEQDAASLRRHGSVKILSLTSATAYSLTGATGLTRVAWTVIGHLPTVQCVEVRRTGNPFSGVSVTLLSIGAPISNEADC